MFFSCLTSCCNINIHHFHICNDCLYFSNRLNLCYCHKFPMKHLLHFNKLWMVYHFMSIQTIDVPCIWKCLPWFFTLLCYFYGYHYGLFLLSICLHIMTSHSTICAMFVSLPYITLCFHYCCTFGTLWYWKCTPCFCNSYVFFSQHHHLLMLLQCWSLHPCNHNFEVWLQARSKHNNKKIICGWYL